jgi:hypothetical protein
MRVEDLHRHVARHARSRQHAPTTAAHGRTPQQPGWPDALVKQQLPHAWVHSRQRVIKEVHVGGRVRSARERDARLLAACAPMCVCVCVCACVCLCESVGSAGSVGLRGAARTVRGSEWLAAWTGHWQQGRH